MIIRVRYVDKKSDKLAAWVGGATVVRPLATLTSYAMFEKVLVDKDDDAEAIKRSVAEIGLSACEVEPRITITDAPGRLSYPARRAAAHKFYFIANADRGSFSFTSKEFFDAHGRVDGSFLGDVELEAALPAGFTNFADPEWYRNDCEVDDDAWIAAYHELLLCGFTELAWNWKKEKYTPRDSAQARHAAEKFYFIAATKYDLPAFFVVRKDYWDVYGKLDDCYNDTDDLDWQLARPFGFHNAASAEFDYKNSRDSDMRHFKIGRRLLLAAGFTELDESEIP
jgi:hypothetical protein